MADSTFLHRWSRRKHEAARPVEAPADLPPAPVAAAAVPAAAAAPVEPPPLPPVESLSIDSDFTPFLAAKVEETVKRAALRKLFTDPHFNVMDGLDVYIDDYSKSDPLPEGLLDRLANVYKTLDEKEEVVVVAGAAEAAPAEAAIAASELPADPAPAPEDHAEEPNEPAGPSQGRIRPEVRSA